MATHYVSMTRAIHPGPLLQLDGATYDAVADDNNSTLVSTGGPTVFVVEATANCKACVRATGTTTAMAAGEGVPIMSGKSREFLVRGAGKTIRVEAL